MPKLFGLDIAGIIDNAIVSAGGVLEGQLYKRVESSRDENNLSGGERPTFGPAQSFRGFIENKSQYRKDGSLIQIEGQLVTIFGASLPDDVIPEANDQLEIENTRYYILEQVERDPAAAVYVLRVEN